jgi:hypothetical protein
MSDDGSSHGDLWKRVLVRLAEMIPPGSFETWFLPVAFTGREGDTLSLRIPNDTFRQSLLDNYSGPLHTAVKDVAGSGFDVHISVDNDANRNPVRCATDRTGSGVIVPLPVVRAAALEAPVQQHAWLVEQLWTHQAVGVIGGGPKLGKSWLALDMAVSIASGTPCLATFQVHVSGPVLLYAAEDSTAALRARIEMLARVRRLDFDNLDVRVITAGSLRLDRLEDQDRLEATVVLHRPLLLVLDPLIRIHAIDENVSGQVAALLGYLRMLQRKTGTAVALVHHVRKNVSPGAGAGYSLRGSSDLYAWLDSFLYLRKHHDQLTLSAEHRSAPGAGPFVLELAQPSGETGAHLRLLSADKIKTGAIQDALPQQILHLLSAAIEPMTVDSLRNRLQVRNQRVVEALRQLSSQGEIQRSVRGYILTTQPSLAIQR